VVIRLTHDRWLGGIPPPNRQHSGTFAGSLGGQSPALRRASNCLSMNYNCQENEGQALCRPERPIPIISSLIRIIFGLIRIIFSFLRIIFGLIRIIFFSSADQVWIDPDHLFFPPDQLRVDPDHLFFPPDQPSFDPDQLWIDPKPSIHPPQRRFFPTGKPSFGLMRQKYV
jgi:hypothetical protein